MMKETWKDIPGYEGYYQINNLGQVRSLPRRTRVKNVTRRNGVSRDEYWTRTGKLIQPLNMHTCMCVRLYREGQPRKTVSVSKLMKLCFGDGNVAIVEQINKDGSIIVVSQNRYKK